jgi:glycosyltransferase 2 family protein
MRKYLNTFFRWGIFVAAVFSLGKAVSTHWQELKTLHLLQIAWVYIGLALLFAIVEQLWAALTWGWILQSLRQSVSRRWALVVFLKHAPARYLPGSIWHLYGRIRAAQHKGIALELATLSVILQPMLVMAAACGLSLSGASDPKLKGLGLLAILLTLHPRVLNLFWQLGRYLRGQPTQGIGIQHYPLRLMLSAGMFMVLRGFTFLMIVLAFTPLPWAALRPVVSGFGFAWLLSLVIPSPAGLGVFEASALTILDDFITPALLLGAVAVYRLVLILAELATASGAWMLSEGQPPTMPRKSSALQ